MHGAPCFPDPRHDEATRNETWSDLSLFEAGFTSSSPFTRPCQARVFDPLFSVSRRKWCPSLEVMILFPLQDVEGRRRRSARSEKQNVFILLKSSSELNWETTDKKLCNCNWLAVFISQLENDPPYGINNSMWYLCTLNCFYVFHHFDVYNF